MLGLLFYLVSLCLIIFCSLSVSILCSVKVLQPPGLFEADKSSGSKSRKWLTAFVGLASITRCLLSSTEFVIFAINVVKNSKQTSSISYYGGFHNITPRLLFACRVLPTILFFTYYGLIGDYFGELYYIIRESSYRIPRLVFCTIGALSSLTLLTFFLILPNPVVLNVVCLVVTLMLSLWIVRHAYGINQFYIHNEDVLLDSTAIDQGRLLARMQRVVCIALCALFSCAINYAADLAQVLPTRHFYVRSAMDLTTVLFSEVGCAWVLVNLLSNNLLGVEGKLQEFCGAQAARFLSGRTSAASSTASSGSVMMSVRTPRNAMSVEDAAQRQEKLLLQQQQLMQRYGNYESIPLGESGLP